MTRLRLLSWVVAGLMGCLVESCRPAGHPAWGWRSDRMDPIQSTNAESTCARQNVPVVVFVAIDGVRADEVFGGVDPKLAATQELSPHEVVTASRLMPNLHRLHDERGAALGAPGTGHEIRSTGPAWCSLPGYQEMLTGHPVRNCHDNLCAAVTRATIADDFAALPCSQPGDVAVIASWETIDRAAASHPSRIVISTGRTHGSMRHLLQSDPAIAGWLTLGEQAASWPGQDDYRPDALTAPLAIEYLRRRRPRFLFVGLGDPDEHAHRGDYHAYLQSLVDADRFLGDVTHLLEALEARGQATILVVTTDHGRAYDFRNHGADAPESGRVWLVVAGAGVRARGLVGARRQRYLADIVPTVRAMTNLAPDPSPESGTILDELLVPGSAMISLNDG